MENYKTELPILRVLPLLFPFKGISTSTLSFRENIVLAVLIYMVVRVFCDYLLIDSAENISLWGVSNLLYPLFLLSVFCYLYSKLETNNTAPTLLYSIIVEVWSIAYLLSTLIWSTLNIITGGMEDNILFYIIFYLLSVSAIAVFFYHILNFNLYTTKGYVLSYIAIVIFPLTYFSFLNSPLWYPDFNEEAYTESDYLLYKHDNDILLRQSEFIASEIDNLSFGNPGELEYFYLGFGSYGPQSVFKNEVQYIAGLMESDFAMPNHSIQLINHLDTIEDSPLAISFNMDRALLGIAEKMDLDEDVLLFYLTSHGSRDHELSVSLSTMQLTPITPQMLRESIDESGIRWRVIIVSACYSGGFIDELKNDSSIVVTASDAEHTSFGCADKREFTYFGEAIFKNNFSPYKPIIQTFEDAIDWVSEREDQENLTNSNPQLWVGPEIRRHLEKYQ